MMIGKSPYLVIGALIFGSIGCASQRSHNLFQPYSNASTAAACDTSAPGSDDNLACDAPCDACDAAVAPGGRRLGRFGARFSHRRFSACDSAVGDPSVCDAPIPEPEPLEPESPQDDNALSRENTPIDTVSGSPNIPTQNLTISSGQFDSEATPAAQGKSLDSTPSAIDSEMDFDRTWQTNPTASPHDTSQFGSSESSKSSSDSQSIWGTDQEFDGAGSSNDEPLSTDDAEPSQDQDSGWKTPTEAEPSNLDSIDNSSFVPPAASETGEANDHSFQPTGDPSSSTDGESILEKVAAERARVAAAQAQASGSPQWIKNPFLNSGESSTQVENVAADTTEPEASQDIVALNAIPKVPSVTQASDTEIQSNRQPATIVDGPEASREDASSAVQDSSTESEKNFDNVTSTTEASVVEPETNVDDVSNQPAPQSIGSEQSSDDVAAAPAPTRSAQKDAAPETESPEQGSAHPSTSYHSSSHQTTNIYMVVNMPPRGEEPSSRTADIGASGGGGGEAVQPKRCQRQRSIVLRAIPADRTGSCKPMLTENLAIPSVRPEPLAPLRGDRSIWAAEPVQQTPAQNVSFVRPGGEIESTAAGLAPIDPVNRGVRLRDLPNLERMPQTPAPFVLPRTLNSPVNTVDRSAVSPRPTEIERLPVRLHAVPQDGHGQPASTGTRARIRVIQPSYQRRVQPIDDANIRNNQTQYTPAGLPSIDVDRFDRELRTLSERPSSATDTNVRR